MLSDTHHHWCQVLSPVNCVSQYFSPQMIHMTCWLGVYVINKTFSQQQAEFWQVKNYMQIFWLCRGSIHIPLCYSQVNCVHKFVKPSLLSNSETFPSPQIGAHGMGTWQRGKTVTSNPSPPTSQSPKRNSLAIASHFLSSWQPLIYHLSVWICLFWKFYTSGMIIYVILHVAFSWSLTFLRFSHIVACIRTSFPCMAK